MRRSHKNRDSRSISNKRWSNTLLSKRLCYNNRAFRKDSNKGITTKMMVMSKRMMMRWREKKRKRRRRKRWTSGMLATREDSIKMNMGYRNLLHPNICSRSKCKSLWILAAKELARVQG